MNAVGMCVLNSERGKHHKAMVEALPDTAVCEICL